MTGASEAFLLTDLIIPAFSVLALSFFIGLSVIKRIDWSLFVAFLKASIFIIYYGLIFDGTFTFLDDWSYVEGGRYLINQGVSSHNLLEHLPDLFYVAGGMHFTYYLFNAEAFRIFGDAYYAPVSLNIVLTLIMAGLITSSARSSLGCSKSLSVGLFVFIALQPSILAWSTIMNGKDTVVSVLTAIMIYAVSRIEKGTYLIPIALLGGACCVLFFTRFYLPILMFAALCMTLLISTRWLRNPSLVIFFSATFMFIIFLFGFQQVLDAAKQLRNEFTNPVYGSIRFLLTPIPFNTSESYSFLNLSQVYHWIMFFPMIFGIYRIWRKASLTARFIVIYFLGMVLLYGMFEELQGPRHRYQLEGIIALFQFYGSLGLIRQFTQKKHGRHYV